VLKGHKPSAIRYLLTSVPYRNQLNFTMDGLQAAASSVDKLRELRTRLGSERFPAGSSPMKVVAEQTAAQMKAALEDDLNTSVAQSAIFEMVKKANTALDAKEVRHDDVMSMIETLQRFDAIFAVLGDDDASKTRAILDWAKAEGRQGDAAPQLRDAESTVRYTVGEIIEKNKQIEEARKARDFRTSDEVRAELTAADVAVKNTKDGVKWDAKYMSKLTPLNPVAIRLNQKEVHAPDHETWGIVTCEDCGEKFALGPNRIYGSTTTEQECVNELVGLLKQDHLHNRPHPNSYELHG
jgi:cysteinyl-tRNA synthetase